MAFAAAWIGAKTSAGLRPRLRRRRRQLPEDQIPLWLAVSLLLLMAAISFATGVQHPRLIALAFSQV